MSFISVPTFATGDSFSAAQANTYWRDNMAALWPYTTNGDMAYMTGSGVISRLGIGRRTSCCVPPERPRVGTAW